MVATIIAYVMTAVLAFFGVASIWLSIKDVKFSFFVLGMIGLSAALCVAKLGGI